jgi:hypothetical protein
MHNRKETQRRHPRITCSHPLGADVSARHEVRLLDLSLGGARLEHTAVLRPGTTCDLRVPLQGETLTLTGRLVWSTVIGRAERPEAGLLFQSGLAFEDVPKATHALLAEFLERQQPPLGS